MENIGLIGAGVMGLRAVEKLCEARHQVFVFDKQPLACERAKSAGANIAKTINDIATQSRIVLLYLPGPKEVESCVSGEEGMLNRLNPDSIIIDQSTVDPSTSVKLASAAKKRSVGYLDAPILGRPANVGQWTLVVGGETEVLNKCLTVLKVLSNNILYQGPSGSGNKVKLLNQMMYGAINAITAEVIAIAVKMEINPISFCNAIAGSGALTVSNLFKDLAARINEGSYSKPIFSVDLLNKDIKIAIEMAQDHNAPPLISKMVDNLNEIAHAQGLGALDTSVMWKCYNSIWSNSLI
jgi:3-hydroxyisobutyrate dehydrogenase